MPRKKLGNVQFNTRIAPEPLKKMRKLAKAAKVRLGELVEEAFLQYIASQEKK